MGLEQTCVACGIEIATCPGCGAVHGLNVGAVLVIAGREHALCAECAGNTHRPAEMNRAVFKLTQAAKKAEQEGRAA